MHFEWDERKNKQLQSKRAVCFEDVFIAISEERLLDILPHHLSEIFAGKRNISARLTVRLEKILGISSHYWLGLQMEYDLFIAKQLEAHA